VAPHSFFASVISTLASRFDAPLFEPHVTVYAGRKGAEDPSETLRAALVACQPFRLSVRGIQSANEFTKTVFAQFEPSPELSRLKSGLQAAAGGEKYELNPHLSLIYKGMSEAKKTEIATSIHLPFTEVLFDCAKAVVSPLPIRSREDVEAWRVVASQSLAE
jgi:2'-5' RNA ligase